MTAPFTLSFDTSGHYIAAAVLRGEDPVAQASEDMARGQAERLMPLLEEQLAQAGLGWRDLDRIGVGVGPGNFTGIRLSVSTARGLALGLGIPAIGVNSFEAIDDVSEDVGVACVPGPRGQGYLRDAQTGVPYLASEKDLADVMQDAALLTPKAETIALGIGRVAARRAPGQRPAPLYIKPADAAPPRDLPPVLLDDA